jgi:hypothetical protein
VILQKEKPQKKGRSWGGRKVFLGLNIMKPRQLSRAKEEDKR